VAPIDPSTLPAPAPATTADLSKDYTCGSFSTKSFASTDVKLLEDRIRVRFLPSPQVQGTAASVRAIVEQAGGSVFVGARELYMQGDANFVRHATKRASFDGDYDPVTIPARDGISIVAGLLKAAPDNTELVAVAHGWFLNANKDVLDVAVFASNVTAANLADCRSFAQKVLSTVTAGPKTLAYGTGQTVETKVSYATFKYTLPAEWILATEAGIHDFARMTFRRRGVYPNGYVELQVGLDAYPGDWASPGAPDGTRTGRLLGLDVTWTQTKATDSAGAWTISKGTSKRDHAVASVLSGSVAGRDEGIKFAESIITK
jgi:hypothetical protein